MHLKRWITSVIALPFLMFLIYRGGLFFGLLIAAATLVALWEYFRIVFAKEDFPVHAVFNWITYVAGVAVACSALAGNLILMVCFLATHFVLAGFGTVRNYQANPVAAGVAARQVLGLIYIAVPLALLILIRNGHSGQLWIYTILAIIFCGDIGAYYVGSYFGRRKLCPAVSPGKTKEGALGGLTANVLAGAIIKVFFFPALSWAGCLVFFVLLGVAGQIGDLFESVLKRAAEIKDSGTILPGHGGILDRIDALLFASPVAYFFIAFVFSC